MRCKLCYSMYMYVTRSVKTNHTSIHPTSRRAQHHGPELRASALRVEQAVLPERHLRGLAGRQIVHHEHRRRHPRRHPASTTGPDRQVYPLPTLGRRHVHIKRQRQDPPRLLHERQLVRDNPVGIRKLDRQPCQLAGRNVQHQVL